MIYSFQSKEELETFLATQDKDKWIASLVKYKDKVSVDGTLIKVKEIKNYGKKN